LTQALAEVRKTQHPQMLGPIKIEASGSRFSVRIDLENKDFVPCSISGRWIVEELVNQCLRPTWQNPRAITPSWMRRVGRLVKPLSAWSDEEIMRYKSTGIKPLRSSGGRKNNDHSTL